MKDLFSAEGRRALESMALSNVLLCFDYDGTLAPIVRDPQDAQMRPSTKALLGQLTERYPCAVVSGRARADVVRFLDPLSLLRVVGNHGSEWEDPAPAIPRAPIVEWHRKMAEACEGLDGVQIEDKTWSLAVHWRGALKPKEARERVLAAARTLPKVRVIHGKSVVNLVSPDAADKGAALLEIRRQLACDTAIYVGDDVTDEDVFALGDPARLLAIRVGMNRRSGAPWFVASQQEVDDVLESLLAFRRSSRREAAR